MYILPWVTVMSNSMLCIFSDKCPLGEINSVKDQLILFITLTWIQMLAFFLPVLPMS